MLGENITITDDVYHPLQAGKPYDGEGVPRQTVTLVDKGVIKNLVYGRRAAKILSVEPTGHGLAEPNTQGEYPSNIVIQGGNTSLEDMIATTDRGILLYTRLGFMPNSIPAKRIVTGMTRDGTFFVEGGKLNTASRTCASTELIDMLNRVLAFGPSVRAGEESEPAVVPPMKVAYFNFRSTTRF